MLKLSLIKLSALILFSQATALCAIDFSVGEVAELLNEQRGFYPTGADNSLTRDNTLFAFSGRGNNKQLNTASTLTNIHNHFKNGGAKRLANYTYTGQMRIDDADGGIGFTFHSQYPDSDTYYRIRRYSGATSFHVRAHPDGYEVACINADSGVIPDANEWYNFRVVVTTTKSKTRFRSKLWKQGDAVPNDWQIDCSDETETRIKKGKPGVWSMGSGNKSWRRLKITAR